MKVLKWVIWLPWKWWYHQVFYMNKILVCNQKQSTHSACYWSALLTTSRTVSLQILTIYQFFSLLYTRISSQSFQDTIIVYCTLLTFFSLGWQYYRALGPFLVLICVGTLAKPWTRITLTLNTSRKKWGDGGTVKISSSEHFFCLTLSEVNRRPSTPAPPIRPTQTQPLIPKKS